MSYRCHAHVIKIANIVTHSESMISLGVYVGGDWVQGLWDKFSNYGYRSKKTGVNLMLFD